jgi:peptide/nickel transport system ATP-binding protein
VSGGTVNGVDKQHDAGAPVLQLENLSVRFGRADPVVSEVSLSLTAGRCLALVGESGSGKSVTARTIAGLAGANAAVDADRLELNGRSLQGLSARQWRAVRGRQVGFVLQDALVSLDPLRTIGREIDDALRLHTRLGPAERRARVLELLHDVGMDDPQLRAGQRAGELSGGLRQRALIASALALQPALLIADEPTTALDATIQAQILELLQTLQNRGTAVLLISHDLAVVDQVADEVAVMTQGRIVEAGPTGAVLGAARHPYTQRLLQAVPAEHPRRSRLSPGTLSLSERWLDEAGAAGTADSRATASAAVVLEATDLSRTYRTPGRNGLFLRAVDGVSFTLGAGETLGVVGESGSGKTTTARLVLGLEAPDNGEVRLFGEPWSSVPEHQRRARRSQIGAVYQDPLSSFDPRLTVGQTLADALSGGRTIRTGQWRGQVAELLELVGLSPALAARGPRTLSGGQRQRVAIARALAPRPRIIVCDEPASALDVSVQAQILDLLDELQDRLSLSYLFISHDLGVVRHMSDRVAVMQRGRIVEEATAEELFTAPQHPYSRQLLDSTPRLRH